MSRTETWERIGDQGTRRITIAVDNREVVQVRMEILAELLLMVGYVPVGVPPWPMEHSETEAEGGLEKLSKVEPET